MFKLGKRNEALERGAVAPEFRGIHGWLNTADGGPLDLAGLAGQVILIEFWTFACINCVRTLPFLVEMDAEYRPAGLAVVGIHTPELAFERPAGNVAAAVAERGLKFPIALDNDFATWDAYRTRYWPTRHVVDAEGTIRHSHIGEGGYRRTDAAIRLLLAERDRAEGR